MQVAAWKVWLALATVYLVWGSTYLAIRVMVETMPPLLSGGLRFIVAGALLFAFLLLRGGRARVRVKRVELGASAIVGMALVLGGNGLVTVGEQDVPSGLAALIVASVPLWVVLWRKVAGEGNSGRGLLGAGVGFAGVAMLVLPEQDQSGAGLAGALLIALAAFLWATGSFFSGRLPVPGDPLVATSYEMLCGGALMMVSGLLAGEASDLRLQAFAASSIAALVYLTLAGSIAAFTSYVWLLRHAPIARVATYAYVNPVIAVLLGWAMLSEPLTTPVVAGAVTIIASVAFSIRHDKDSEASCRAEELDLSRG
jgi:drug/metabolite transporter (DMT)-like permease